MQAIPHSRPWITEADQQAVAEVLATHMLAHGTVTAKLERRLSEWVGASGGVAAGSGSAALVLALGGLGVGKGDEVILPAYVCASVLEAVRTVEATPVLCDVGEDWVVTAQDAARRRTGRTKAMIVPHMYGVFADLDSFRSLGVPLIEDCAQAVDAKGRRRLGGDVAIFSFHPTKCLTSGEGGVAVAADPATAERMRVLRDGARDRSRGRLFSPLSNIAAALALSQLERFSEMLDRRKRLAARYAEALAKVRPECLNRRALEHSMFFRFPVRVRGGLESCQAAFLKDGIHVRKGVDELLHRTSNLADDDFPISVRHFDSTVSLPIYPALTPQEEDHCVERAAAILGRR